jgi:hypothetical protein
MGLSLRQMRYRMARLKVLVGDDVPAADAQDGEQTIGASPQG